MLEPCLQKHPSEQIIELYKFVSKCHCNLSIKVSVSSPGRNTAIFLGAMVVNLALMISLYNYAPFVVALPCTCTNLIALVSCLPRLHRDGKYLANILSCEVVRDRIKTKYPELKSPLDWLDTPYSIKCFLKERREIAVMAIATSCGIGISVITISIWLSIFCGAVCLSLLTCGVVFYHRWLRDLCSRRKSIQPKEPAYSESYRSASSIDLTQM